MPPLLGELEERARRDQIPIIARSTGRMLSTLVHCMQANRILELGTGYGYATLWMGFALPPAGKIWTVDPDAARTRVASEYFARAGRSEQIEVINQPALDTLTLFPQRNLDIVFIDAVKAEYAAYLELCLPLLKLSGLVVVDNLFLSGRAAHAPRDGDDEELQAIRAFNDAFLNHEGLDGTILDVGGGTGIAARTQ
ncbi:MAG: O-methyltransferase [Vulcanimicrobiaceae bacterium]